jgi:hypothetical protein
MLSRKLFVAITLALVLTSCATQPYQSAYDPPGFFTGFLHGMIAVPAFVASLFFDVRIYAFPNSGVWYDFGYLLGIGGTLGGGVKSL